MICFEWYNIIAITQNKPENIEAIKEVLSNALLIAKECARKDDAHTTEKDLRLDSNCMHLSIRCDYHPDEDTYTVATIIHNTATKEVSSVIDIKDLQRLADEHYSGLLLGKLSRQVQDILPDNVADLLDDQIQKQIPERLNKQDQFNVKRDKALLDSEKCFYYGEILPYIKSSLTQQMVFYPGFIKCQFVSDEGKGLACVTRDNDWCIAPAEMIDPKNMRMIEYDDDIGCIAKRHVAITCEHGKLLADGEELAKDNNSPRNDYDFDF